MELVPTLPRPAPAPNLRDALERRAALFGPVCPDEAPVRQHGIRQRISATLRGLANLLEPAVALERACDEVGFRGLAQKQQS